MRALILILLLLIAGAGGAYWWYENNMAPLKIPVAVKSLESQLRKDSAAVGFVNLELARKLEKYLLGAGEPQVVSDSLKQDFGDLYYHLSKSGMVLQSQLNYAIASILDADSPQFAIALFGQFNLTNLQKRLETNKYLVEEKTHNGKKYLETASYNNKSCGYEDPVNVYWDSNAILIGSRGYFPKLLDGYSKPSAGASQIHRYKLLLGSVLKPHSLANGFSGALKTMLQQASRNSGSLKRIDITGDLAPYPPSLKLEAVANHDNAAWAQGLVAGFTQWQAAMAGEIAKNGELKNQLVDLQLEPAGNSFTVRSFMDKPKLFAAGKIPKQFFSVYVPSISSARAGEKVEEETVASDEMKKYLATVDVDTIPVFKKEEKEKISHAVFTGPFAVYLNGIRLASDNNVPEMKVSMLSADVPNLFFEDVNEKGVGRLTIEDVVDKDNNSLLENKECVLNNFEKQGQFESAFRNITLDVVVGRKNATKEVAKSVVKVKLKKDVKSSDIAAIKGKVHLHIPDKVDVVQLSAAKDKSLYSNDKFRVKIRGINGPSANYQVSGDKGMLIDVRARNEQTKYLKRTGSISMNRLFDGGEIGAWDFAGQPKTIELVVAGNIIKQSFDYEIKTLDRHQLIPVYVKNPITLSSEKKFRKKKFKSLSSKSCSEKEVEQSDQDLKPFLLCIKHGFTPWGDTEYSGVFELLGPVAPELKNNLAVATFELDGVELQEKDGVKEYPVSVKQVTQFTVTSAGNTSRMQLRIRSPEGRDAFDRKIVSLKGKVTVNLVKALETVTLDPNNIGHTVTSKTGTKIMFEGFEDDMYYFRVYGDEDRIANVFGMDSEEREIRPIFPKIMYPEDRSAGYAIVAADINTTPDKLVIELAEKLDRLEYPFRRMNK